MKLVSMTDFVLAESKHGIFKYTNTQIRDYANFLKQPLNKGMFIPCDSDGNVLEEPKRLNYSYNPLINQMHDEKVSKYQQAKERVLFKGYHWCKIDECIKFSHDENNYISYDEYDLENLFIEDFVGYEEETIQLTESAIKQFM